MNKFWVIENILEPNQFVNAESFRLTRALSSSCLFPSKKVAEDFIETELYYSNCFRARQIIIFDLGSLTFKTFRFIAE